MIYQWDVFSYIDLCKEVWFSLQRWMNYKVWWRESIVLMSLRRNAPYADRIEDNWTVLIYEWHDIQKNHTDKDPKTVDQPEFNPSWKRTQNWLFHNAAQQGKSWSQSFECVKVFEKLKDGIWTFNGIFKLTDSWIEESLWRNVFKFRLEVTDLITSRDESFSDLHHVRLIPASVKREVWIRDKGKCVTCWSYDNLHFDHIIPFSKWWSSLISENIQLLCARHNLSKSANIQ